MVRCHTRPLLSSSCHSSWKVEIGGRLACQDTLHKGSCCTTNTEASTQHNHRNATAKPTKRNTKERTKKTTMKPINKNNSDRKNSNGSRETDVVKYHLLFESRKVVAFVVHLATHVDRLCGGTKGAPFKGQCRASTVPWSSIHCCFCCALHLSCVHPRHGQAR